MKWNNDTKDPKQHPLLMGTNDKPQISLLSQLNGPVSHDSQCPLPQSTTHKWSWSPVTIRHWCLGVCGCECAKSSTKISESGKLQRFCRRKSLFPVARSYTLFCNPDFLHNYSRFFLARLNLHTGSDPESGKSSIWKVETAIAGRCCEQPS